MTLKLLSGTHRMVPSNVQLPNSDLSHFGYQHVKDHGEEGGGQVGEAGELEGVGILE